MPRIDFAKISKYLLIAATALVFLRNQMAWLVRPFEFLLALSIITSFFYFIPRNLEQLKRVDKKIYWAVGIFLGSILVATIISYFRYPAPFRWSLGVYYGGLAYVARFLVVITAFFLVFVYAKNDTQFRRRIWLAFLAPLVLGLALLFPEWAFQRNWFAGNGKFYGFAEPPITASSLLIAFSIVYALFLAAAQKKQFWPATVFFLTSAAFGSLILWTLARGYWLGWGATAAAGLVAAAWHYGRTRKVFLKKIAVNALLAAAVFAASFLMLPTYMKSMVLLRIYRQYEMKYSRPDHDIVVTDLNTSDLKNIVQDIAGTKYSATAKGATISLVQETVTEEQRPKMWREYWKILIKNPLGLGFNRATDEFMSVLHIGRSSHNTLLDIIAWGGIGAATAWLYLIYRAFAAKKPTEPDDSFFVEWLSVRIALAGILVASNFHIIIFGKPEWVLLAIALAQAHTEKQ